MVGQERYGLICNDVKNSECTSKIKRTVLDGMLEGTMLILGIKLGASEASACIQRQQTSFALRCSPSLANPAAMDPQVSGLKS